MLTRTVIAIGLLISCSALATSVDKQIKAVENGLRPSVLLKGESTWSLQDRMQHYGVPGVSIAVIKDSKVHWSKSYGVADKASKQPVTSATLFQAGSVSKPVAAVGALKLAQMGKLSLDAPVNNYLKGWSIPDNQFTKQQHVALKHLLSHTAGLTVHGFPGYPIGTELPSEVDILDGKAPANTPPIRVDMLPGSQFRYSGGGYTVLQKLMADVTDKPFEQLLDDLVLKPAGMSRSSFQQPLPKALVKHAATGYLPNGFAVNGGHHLYPEMAAAGLWTTAEDLAHFAINIQQSALGSEGKLLTQKMTTQMLQSDLADNWGLGFSLIHKEGEKYFYHGGVDQGFYAYLVSHQTKGYGLAIMINSIHPEFVEELRNSVASVYQWDKLVLPALEVLPISKQEKQRIAGRYYYSEDMLFTISSQEGKVFMQYLNSPPYEMFRIGENQYMRKLNDAVISFESGPSGIELVFNMPNGERQTRRRLKESETVPFEKVVANDLKGAEKAYVDLFKSQQVDKENIMWGLLHYVQDNGVAVPQIEILQLTSKLFPEYAEPWMFLGFTHLQMGDKQKALNYLQKSLAINPNNSMVKQQVNLLTAG